MSRAPYVSVPVRSASANHRLGAADIVASLSAEIQAGHLPAGCRLPPVRVLEKQLGLSKNTVQAAYDELVARGLLEARPRDGLYVHAPSLTAPLKPSVTTPPVPRLRPVPAVFQTSPRPDTVKLSTVMIDPELLPRDQLAECMRSVLHAPGLDATYDYQGYPPLRAAIAERLRRRGMQVSAEQVIVTVGSQQGLDIVARALEVRRIALENPLYPYARLLFESHGLQTVPLTVDPFSGIDLEQWENELRVRRPGLLYAITSFQNPTGYSYSSHELESLLELAARYDIGLLEDDWGSDMLSDGEYRPALRLLGGPDVLYLNSFTKKLWPTLRVGYLVAPSALVPALVAGKRLSTLGSPPILEATITAFLERGYYDTHLRRLQAALDARYQACLETLRELMPEDVRWTTPGGGPTLWLEVPRYISLRALGRALLDRGVEITLDQETAFLGEPHLNGFRVSYAYSNEPTLRRALSIVAETLSALRDHSLHARG